MRVAVATESFLPQINGVTNSVLRVLEHLERNGDTALVMAPGRQGPSFYAGAEVRRMAALPMPGYPDVQVSLRGTRGFSEVLAEFKPDVVHLASPFVLGPPVIRAANALGVPVVSVFQTDVASFARHYGFGVAERIAWRRIRSIHSACDRTLVPSHPTIAQLEQQGIPRLHYWPRGVDGERFHPRHRSSTWRKRMAPQGEVIVGFLGRLAHEKQVHNLAVLADVPGVSIVIVGDGPARADLERLLPQAHFLGFLGGTDLSEALASFDLLVHTGEHETFCQSVQEGLASGIPVVAPRSGGPIDLIAPSHTGWLYEPGNATDLRDKIRDLVGDEAKRKAMGVSARESVATRTWAGVCDRLMEHYSDAIGRQVSREVA